MDQSKPSSVTIEEAVARMVNMDYIPAGFTLLVMTGAFRREARVEYENAKIDGLPEDQIAPLKVRMESCRAKHSLAKQLLENLQYEVKHPESSMIVIADDSSSQVRLTLESVSNWAADRYGTGIPEWAPEITEPDIDLTGVMWEDVTIKIYTNYKIGLFFGERGQKKSSFQKIKLMGERKHEPNKKGVILIALSKKKKYPPKNSPTRTEAKAVSELRNSLRMLTGLSGDPFYKINPTDGWKPRFELIDDGRKAEERAKKKARQENIDDPNNHELEKHTAKTYFEDKAISETRDFDDDDDDAGKFLKR